MQIMAIVEDFNSSRLKLTLIIVLWLSYAKFLEASDEHQVCGTVVTSEGSTIYLKENTTLSQEEFEKVHAQKLNGAKFDPVSERNCVIQVCGFTSFDTPYGGGLIGSSSDYSDCRRISQNETASSTIYNSLFNASSLSCACWNNNDGCRYTCDVKRQHWSHVWKDDDCALLFQDEECNNCYYNPIPIAKDGEFVTDVSHPINSVFVRDGCVLRQNVPAFKHYWRFKNYTLPITYDSSYIKKVMSAFYNEPETFSCYCGVKPGPDPTPPPTPTPTPAKPTNNSDNLGVAVIVLSVVTFLSLSSLGYIAVRMIMKKRFLWNSNNGKRDSNDSCNTMITTASYVSDYSIINLPFDSTFDISRELFHMQREIDHGNFGKIMLGQLQVAVKVLKNPSDKEACRALQQEIKILSRIGSHPNVVRILGKNSDNYEKGELYLFVEYCEHGSIESYLKKVIRPHINEMLGIKVSKDWSPSSTLYSDQEVLNKKLSVGCNDLKDIDPRVLKIFFLWAEHIANGMEFIASRMKVIHGDLAARNILLNYKLVAKIADFGLARKSYINVNEGENSLNIATPFRWLSPEVLNGDVSPCYSSDIWSFGCLVWEIFTLCEYQPYDDKNNSDQVKAAAKRCEKPGKLVNYIPKDVYKKVLECWEYEPNQRPSFESLIKFFSDKRHSIKANLFAHGDAKIAKKK